MRTQNPRTVTIMVLAVLAGLIAIGSAVFQGERRVSDVNDAADAELARAREDLRHERRKNDEQRRVNDEQGLLIDELLVARTPEQQAEAIERSRERLSAGTTTTTTPRSENRPTQSSQSPANENPGTTTPPDQRPAPPPTTEPADEGVIGCIGPICI